MPRNGETVGHASYEVANCSDLLELIAITLPCRWQQCRVFAVSRGEIRNHALRFLANGLQLRKIVEPSMHEALELALLDGKFGREARERAARRANIVNRLDARAVHPALGL